jgi:hypothetical protein
MALYYFRLRNGEGGISDLDADIVNLDAAWAEMANVCADLVADATRKLKPDAEWQLELLDVSKKPLFRIRVVAETVGT